ncbi:MAG TPA: single-stranded DNA-binding protein [Candidatus Fimenecus excrementigallinarum]|uniref:Single-stranded DNA-binding protein n=1 Tax=Candidatus Fimenecus excrementigallinarum TaxID=2840816 RepID=A0A9D1IHD9_9FIRM|nr:single-stranded DNA-binding protein [Candidatus Fimenecus excrementigallinarum]
MLNCAVIMGRLTADPELRTTNSGISVTSFTVAVDRRFQRQGEDKQTDFINVVAWRQSAEFVTRFFRKGSMIAVQGSIQTRNYEDRNGNKRTAFEIVADNVSFCGSKAETGTGAAPAARPAPAPAYQSGDAEGFSVLPTGDDDAFPFAGANNDDGLPF